jgi:hypothetical protein
MECTTGTMVGEVIGGALAVVGGLAALYVRIVRDYRRVMGQFNKVHEGIETNYGQLQEVKQQVTQQGELTK